MAQRLLKVRVRPPRVAVLIDRNANESDLFLAFEFFSRLWGGRFAHLLAVESKSCDDLTQFRLGVSRPEFVYGIGLDDDHWSKAIVETCQPRGYGRLRPEFVNGLKRDHAEDYYLVDHALIHLFRTRDQGKSYKRALRLVTSKDAPTLTAYCAATFGVHHQNLRKDFVDLETSFTGTTTTAFVELASEFVKECQQSWLDVTGHELNPLTFESGPLAPTVVLVNSKVEDLALFWNLRAASDTMHPAWIIPIPAESAADLAIFEKLKEWLLAFLPYGPRPNFCYVTSQSVEESVCRDFAVRFQTVLAGTPIELVDYQPSRNQLPIVIPFEYETSWAVEITGRKLTIQPPKSKLRMV
ncbi:MAG TPA: hypothetical protein VMF69_10885 [Gemmataceae bacterium]|nr:hypothetical protein [Gemmataceae bacterium]